MSDTRAQIAELLHEAGETHHQVYRITDGVDADWASWYADSLIHLSELPKLLGTAPVRSELVYILVKLDRDFTRNAPGGRWEDYYRAHNVTCRLLRWEQPWSDSALGESGVISRSDGDRFPFIAQLVSVGTVASSYVFLPLRPNRPRSPQPVVKNVTDERCEANDGKRGSPASSVRQRYPTGSSGPTDYRAPGDDVSHLPSGCSPRRNAE